MHISIIVELRRFSTFLFVQCLLLARLMGQCCFARWRLSSVVVVCNAAGGHVGGRVADTARRASTVTFR